MIYFVMLTDGGNPTIDFILVVLGVVIPGLAADDRLFPQKGAPGADGNKLDKVQV